MTNIELNRTIADGTVRELILVEEARQCKMLGRAADMICSRPNVRLVLVCGGSAAGKTTTAKRICTQLRVNGREALLLSTDDYFVGEDQTPRNEKGELDYEHVECVDIRHLVDDIAALCRGETVPVRRFDFVNHCPCLTAQSLSLPKDGIVVLEGIHALNPRLTEGYPEEAKFRIFVEPRPTLEVRDCLPLDTSSARFIRRMVRDDQFRKITPMKTVDLWPNVLAGERRWIDPYRDIADFTFDSYLVYELAVLKPYVIDLLRRAWGELGDVLELRVLIRILDEIDTVSPRLVPGDSIIRETIGGSLLEY